MASLVGPAVALARRTWRQLTSMRTALVLLFLLALAAIPGSLFPQRGLGVEKVRAYFVEHPKAGPWLDRLGLFEVYSSPWFGAIYLLLFVSLVGCLVPRLRSHAVALFRPPPDAPQRLDRMPAYASGAFSAAGSADVAGKLAALLRARRFRVVVRDVNGTTTVSAEKGYLKETGNLLFHFALLGLLLGVAVGSSYGWHANRLVVAGPENAFCDTLQQYDDYALGARVGAGDLPPFCVRLDDFRASYLDNGQPLTFQATMSYTSGPGGAERPQRVEVNHPLRLSGANLYLIAHGYAPMLRYTDRYGQVQTTTVPFLAAKGDETLTSTGAALFPDANVNPKTGERDPKSQLGFSGVYLPTVPPDPSVGRSLHPEERDPRLMLVAYQGNLGMDVGLSRTVDTIDQGQIDNGQLVKFGDPHLMKIGDSWTLPDGTRMDFLGTRPWVVLAIRHDPGERPVLVAAILLLVGLLLSLTGRRRRVWFRVGDSEIEAGGLPRTDYPGFAAEFDGLIQAAREERIF